MILYGYAVQEMAALDLKLMVIYALIKQLAQKNPMLFIQPLHLNLLKKRPKTVNKFGIKVCRKFLSQQWCYSFSTVSEN